MNYSDDVGLYGTNISRSGRLPDTTPEIADQGGGPPFDAGQLVIVTIPIVGHAIWRVRSIGVAMNRTDRSEDACRTLCETESRSEEIRERRQHIRGLLGAEEQNRSLSALLVSRMLTQANETWGDGASPLANAAICVPNRWLLATWIEMAEFGPSLTLAMSAFRQIGAAAM